jgi:glycogen debranching enzyme
VQQHFQPFLHNLVTTIAAPSATLSGTDAQIRCSGAQGFFLGERRMLSEMRLVAFGHEPEVIRTRLQADGLFEVIAIIRDGSEPTPDATLLLSRRRRQQPDGFSEQWTFRNHGFGSRSIDLELFCAADFADTAEVKGGRPPTRSQPAVDDGDGLGYRYADAVVSVHASIAPVIDIEKGRLQWDIIVAPHAESVITVDVRAAAGETLFRSAPACSYAPTVQSCDQRFTTLIEWSFHDLAALALTDGETGDIFISAGSPWFLTLFGRDSLWAARMLLPFGVDLAASTLRVLARRQGTLFDTISAEQPGRILHEARPAVLNMGAVVLQPLYYGSIDATPLWISTFAEAWRWGLAGDAVAELLPALQAAARWLVDISDADDDGLLEYIDHSGSGLSNQGWKDSGDAVNWIDGRLAVPPIALAEAQGYAYRAALDAAEMFDAFGVEGSEGLRAFAVRLKEAFHRCYWLSDDRGDYIAVALDGNKRPVDAVTTNPGHLLATGLLDAEQEALVVRRMMAQLACPAGLRTLAPGSARFNPVSYHNGSIWPHDVAICARGMMLAGFPDEAAQLLRGLLVAVESFGGRLPELYGYDLIAGGVVPYPASCCPQAWSAAAGAVALWSTAPVVPGPDGPVFLEPALLVDEVDIDGLVCGGQRLTVRHRRGKIEIIGSGVGTADQ